MGGKDKLCTAGELSFKLCGMNPAATPDAKYEAAGFNPREWI